MLPVLEGVVMELQDCALPLLRGNYGKTCVSNIITEFHVKSYITLFLIVFWIVVWKRSSLDSKLIEELMCYTKDTFMCIWYQFVNVAFKVFCLLRFLPRCEPSTRAHVVNTPQPQPKNWSKYLFYKTNKKINNKIAQKNGKIEQKCDLNGSVVCEPHLLSLLMESFHAHVKMMGLDVYPS